MRYLYLLLFLLASTCALAQEKHSYLFVWAGDKDHKASDFLGILDADPASKSYGAIVASIPVGAAGTHPHHTELEMPANGHLLANGFHSGQTWLFDLTKPLQPRILTSFRDLGDYNHPHTYIRTGKDRILATFQYSGEHQTGGLVEMDERGKVKRTGSAADELDKQIFPYSVRPMPQFDRAVSTSTDMDQENKAASGKWVQVWRLSDLKLLRSFPLPPGPRGDEHLLTGEPKLLPDGKSVYIHTFMCGLYLLRGVESDTPKAQFVHGFQGKYCGVPVLAGRYWLQPVPDEHAVLALDISDPEKPREVSRVALGDRESPHWMAIDATGRRLVVNSSGYVEGNRLYVLLFDPATGKLALDERFRDAGSDQPGVDMNGKKWPHGFTGNAAPHGTLFSR